MYTDSKMILALLPLVLIQIIFIIICLRDWVKRTNFHPPGKWAWFFIIIFLNILGPILYLIFGKEQTHD